MDDGATDEQPARRFALLLARWRARTDPSCDDDAHALLAELAWRCATSHTAIAERALVLLADDAHPEIHEAAVRGLRHLLDVLHGVPRMEVLASWVTSQDSACREAIASALGSQIPVLGATIALSSLAQDDSAMVRAAACAAATRRLEPGGDGLAAVLCRGTRDCDAGVRRIAILGLKRLARTHAALALRTLTVCARSTDTADTRHAVAVLAELGSCMPSATQLLRSIASHGAEPGRAEARRVLALT